MIVKLLENGSSDWVLFDNILKIRKVAEEYDFDPMKHPVDESGYLKTADYRLLDTWQKHMEDKVPGKIGVVTLMCTLTNGFEYSISFDTQAYICNDEGKTIEKVVANY